MKRLVLAEKRELVASRGLNWSGHPGQLIVCSLPQRWVLGRHPMLEIGPDGNICTTETSKSCESGFSSWRGSER